jgi:predicted NAD/FAD-binding protein
LSAPVQAISTSSGSSKVTVKLPIGDEEFDHVILATHSDTSLKMLRQGLGITEDEKNILESFAWSKNRAVLHSDINVSVLFFCRSLSDIGKYAAHAQASCGMVLLELSYLLRG